MRHSPPTGKRCKYVQQEGSDVEDSGLSRDAAVKGGSPSSDSVSGQLIQEQILQQLQKVNQRLDRVEHRMAEEEDTRERSRGKLSTDTFSQAIGKSKSTSRKQVSSDSSSDESEAPSLQYLKSKTLQQKVDRRIRDLDEATSKIKMLKLSQKGGGGNIEVHVKNKVFWPHEAILGGVNRQRISYDQLSLTQWVQGFCRNILEENSSEKKDIMISYMADLMEDATDFSWQGAKAAHAVLLCDMERGALQWDHTDRIDRICRVHAQKHMGVGHSKNHWQKSEQGGRKPWFCKLFQSGTCIHKHDHKTNGRLHKHICAHCFSIGKHLNHAEKDCLVERQNQSKND